MLGKYATATIYGSVYSSSVYSGYIDQKTDGLSKTESVYILSRQPIKESVNCTVIALAYTNDSSPPKLIMAPSGEIFYQQEIDFLLKHVRNFKYNKLNCLYEKSCGAVIFHINEKNTVKVLLVKNHNGKYWSFPKGHMELDETEEETAIREIKEETGLNVTLLDNYRETSDYIPFGRIKKHVVFFLAQADQEQVIIQPSEIDSYMWASFDEAEENCKYENDLRILHTAKERLFGENGFISQLNPSIGRAM